MRTSLTTLAGTIFVGALSVLPALAQTTPPAGADRPADSGRPADSMREKTESTHGKMNPAREKPEAMREREDGLGQVEAVQRMLKEKGHDPGEIDGLMGPRTRQAIKDFQQKEGLTPSGRLDSPTRSKLGLQARSQPSR